MSKVYIKSIPFLPYSINMSDMEYSNGNAFDVGDEDNAVVTMFSALRADSFLLQILKELDDRQKIILMFLVLREAGYNLNHADCAKVLRITRERYMVLVKEVRIRAGKILQMNPK